MIFLPTTASARKRRILEDAGASLVLFGHDIIDTEREARRVAVQEGSPYISPYNDLQVTHLSCVSGCVLAMLNIDD